MGALGRRVAVAVVGIPLAAGALYAGGLVLALLLSLLAAVGAWEFQRLAGQARGDALGVIGILVAGAIPMVAHGARLGWVETPLSFAGGLFVAFLALLLWSRSPTERPIEAATVAVFAALYSGGTLTFAYVLRHHRFIVEPEAGLALVLYPVALTWISDTGAYAAGRMAGRRKLMASVSPNKTIEGTTGGLAVTMFAAVLYNDWVLQPVAQLALAPWTALIFGVVVSLTGQVGDLVESLFKRQAGVKDSSTLLSAHGGVLDRLDSLYFVFPTAYLILSRLLLAAPR